MPAKKNTGAEGTDASEGAKSTANTAIVATPASQESKLTSGVEMAEVQKLLTKYSAIASAAALLPVPGLDLAGMIGVQIKMLHDLGKMHDVKLEDNKAKVAVTALVTSVPAASFSAAAASVLKVVPGIGTALGALALPAYFAASTYAVGRVFHSHFSSGGTLLDFDPVATKEAYKQHFQEKGAK